MLINPSQNVAFQFSLVDSTGAAANATGTPTATVALDGVDTAVVATVTNPATGDYKVAFTAGAWSAFQQVQVRVAFTMDGIASHAIVWSATVSPIAVAVMQDEGGAIKAVDKASGAALATATSQTTLQNSIDSIPTNPLLTNDNRIPATAPPTNTQFEARTKLAADYADKATLDVVAADVAGLDGEAMRGTDGAYTGTPPTAEQNAAHVRTELAAELGRIDAAITTRHAAGVKLPATIAAGDIAANAIDANSIKADAATKLATAVWSATTRTLTSFGSLVASVWSNATRTLTGSTLSLGPTAARSQADIYYNVFAGGTLGLYARVLDWDGSDLQQAEVSSIAYTIYALDSQDEDSRIAITGHTAVALTKTDVLWNAVQSDEWASDWNFKMIPNIAANAAFIDVGTKYLVEVTVTPTSGQAIIVRFIVKAT